MLFIKYEGWFQCRLATDPDPVDEPRGVSGYMKALPGEPDFDRIVRFHSPLVVRDYTPKIGVFVSKVAVDGVEDPKHPLLGARVDLNEDPKFYGFNGIVADDGVEAIVPFDFSISKGSFKLRRAHADTEEFPFEDLKAQNGIIASPAENAEATGIYDIALHLKARHDKLVADLESAKKAGDALRQDIISRRIAFLESRSASMFFNFRMVWSVGLAATPTVTDPDMFLPKKLTSKPWSAYMWMGAWDPDGLCGYAGGCLRMNWE
jgi:hypothetical protein